MSDGAEAYPITIEDLCAKYCRKMSCQIVEGKLSVGFEPVVGGVTVELCQESNVLKIGGVRCWENLKRKIEARGGCD